MVGSGVPRATSINPDAIAKAIGNIQKPQYSKDENPTLEELFSSWEKDEKLSMAKSSFSEYGRETRFFVRVVTECNKGKPPRIGDLTGDAFGKNSGDTAKTAVFKLNYNY